MVKNNFHFFNRNYHRTSRILILKRRIVRIKRIDIEKFVLQAKRELNEFLEVAFNPFNPKTL